MKLQDQARHQWSCWPYHWWWPSLLSKPWPQQHDCTSWTVLWLIVQLLRYGFCFLLKHLAFGLQPRFSFGSGEWRNCADTFLAMFHPCFTSPCFQAWPLVSTTATILRKQMNWSRTLQGGGFLSPLISARFWSWKRRGCQLTYLASHALKLHLPWMKWFVNLKILERLEDISG